MIITGWKVVNHSKLFFKGLEVYDWAKIANLHVHHHQMVNAVIAWKGGDGFAAASWALHCGVQKVVVPVI